MIAGESTALAALGIVATIAAALVWLLKKLFTQNDTTLRHIAKSSASLASAIEALNKTLEANDETRREDRQADREYQKYMRSTITKVSEKQDIIHDIVAKTITVENMYVNKVEEEKNG